MAGVEIAAGQGLAQVGTVISVIRSYDPRRNTYMNDYDVLRKQLIQSSCEYLECFTLFKDFKKLTKNIIDNIDEDFVKHINIIIYFLDIYTKNKNDGTPVRGNINVNLFQYHEYHLSAIDSIEWLEKFLNINHDFTINNVNIKKLYYEETPQHLKDKFNNTKYQLRPFGPNDVIELYDVLQSPRKLSRKCSIITTGTSLFTAYGFANVSLRTSAKTKFYLVSENNNNLDYVCSNENVGIKHVDTKKCLSYDKKISKMLWDDKNMETTFNVKITNGTTNNVTFDRTRKLRNNDYVSLECTDNTYIYLPSIYNYDRYTWNHVKTGNASSPDGKLCQVFVVRLVENNL